MSINNASFFWIEAGDMQGGSRNQIEFTDDIVSFFDGSSRAAGQAFLAFNTKIKGYGALTNRAQEYDQWVNKWRLSLITKAKGGVDYAGRVVGFEKRQIGKSYVYVISVVDLNSADYLAWKAKSKYVGSTGGSDGREYGYF
ncbi:MAG: hypothetical protein JJT99_15465 [Rhodobacteraceae bacterium]|nr:hypothetical protein [Paracoccaceae bacterium]